MNRRLAITGGTGFIGRHVIEAARRSGFHVQALARSPQAPAQGVTWIAGDMADSVALRGLLEGADVLVHAAGVVRGVTHADFDATNVEGMRNLLAEVEAHNPAVPLLYLSSLAARHPGFSHYARSKYAAEQLLREQAAMPWTILRPPAVYGPGDQELSLLFAAMKHGLGVHPRHQGRFSMLYVTDLATAVVRWAQAPCNGEILELHDGCAEGYSWPDVLSIAADTLQRRIRPIPVSRGLMLLPAAWNVTVGRWFGPPMLTPGKIREMYHDNWVCCNDAVGRSLDWAPQVGFREGIGRLFSEAA